MSDEHSPGYVYLLINYSMPGLVKVVALQGRQRNVQKSSRLSRESRYRSNLCSTSSSQTPPPLKELFTTSSKKGVTGSSENREFFEAPIDEVVKLMLQFREVGPRVTVTIAPGGQTSAIDLPEDMDPLFYEAARVCIERGEGSTSLVQRVLRVGYGQAARIIDQLHMAGILGPSERGKPREVLIGEEQLDD